MPHNSTTSKKKPAPSATQIVSGDKGVSIGRDVMDSVIATGDNTIINQTFVQKVFNFFKSDTETLDQRNRRILLNHVDNFWVKGVLEKSLHGAAMLELDIKEDPEAVTYPWAIKKEATGETLPAGTSMLEIFEQIGVGRSLLILGAPGSGKTTMLLELARQLIERARQNADEPIPMVFNLASWTEKLTLADWLAQELNNIYYVPRKTAPDWVRGNKLLLLLDGLDEVRQESRAKCVDAINQFRKEHGLTSLAVCSRSQDYEELGAKLAFDGAIEVQPLTQKQVSEFFNRFEKEMAGLKSVLKKDSALREMAETPLFLSIMVMAYRDKQDVDILISQNQETQRKHLFDNYIERMIEHRRFQNATFKKQNIVCGLSWLSNKMIGCNATPYLIEDMQLKWLTSRAQKFGFLLINTIITGFIAGLIIWPTLGLTQGLIAGGLLGMISFARIYLDEFQTTDHLSWSWPKARKGLKSGLIYGSALGLVGGFVARYYHKETTSFLSVGVYVGLLIGIIEWLRSGLSVHQVLMTTRPGQKITFSIQNFFLASLFFSAILGSFIGIAFWILARTQESIRYGLENGLSLGILVSLVSFGGFAVIRHYSLRLVIHINSILPFRLIPFLDYCTNLIFLHRVGGGYIFVHRLLMEHFAAMYKEE